MENRIQLKENINHGNELFPINIYYTNLKEEEHDLYIHFHEEIEVIYIKSGKGKFNIELQSYEVNEGDILIINKSEIHSGIGDKELGCECETIVFNIGFLQNMIMDICQNKYISPVKHEKIKFIKHIKTDNVAYNDVKKVIKEIIETFNKKEIAYEVQIKGLIYILVANLFKYKCVIENEKLSKIYSEKINKIKLIVNYINQNYNETMSISKLASIVNYSEYHFIRFFKEQINMTCVEYINMIRINNCAKLLIDTNLSITEIALENGFNNISYFNKKFKEYYHMTPMKYRKSH